jgi:transposase
MSCLITMSQKELHRLELIQRIRGGSLTVVEAAALLRLSRSQVHRLLQAYDLAGADGLVSKKRGRPSNRRHSEDFRNLVLDLVREHYGDFGPTLAAEKLLERHRIAVSKETLRQWMMEVGLWVSRRERKKRIFQPRGRRDCFGELVQIDGSLHWWFEGRGSKCALLVYIDDATGKLLHLRFAGSENTFDYLHATKAYLQQWGKPIAFYSDKHGVFRTTHASKKDRTSGLTQFGRALQHRHHLRQHPAGQGTRRARQPDAAGSPRQGTAAARHRHDRGGECLCAGVHGRLQSPLWQGAAQSEGHASAACRA